MSGTGLFHVEQWGEDSGAWVIYFESMPRETSRQLLAQLGRKTAFILNQYLHRRAFTFDLIDNSADRSFICR